MWFRWVVTSQEEEEEFELLTKGGHEICAANFMEFMKELIANIANYECPAGCELPSDGYHKELARDALEMHEDLSQALQHAREKTTDDAVLEVAWMAFQLGELASEADTAQFSRWFETGRKRWDSRKKGGYSSTKFSKEERLLIHEAMRNEFQNSRLSKTAAAKRAVARLKKDHKISVSYKTVMTTYDTVENA